MEMISRRLTKIEKIEILEEFRSGGPVNNLAKKYNCSANTINRTVKTLLTNDEYNSLKEERSKIKRTKIKSPPSESFNQEREVLEEDKNKLKNVIDSNNKDKDETFKLEAEKSSSFHSQGNDDCELESKNEFKDDENIFEEIVPLISTFNFETHEQKVDCQLLDKVTLPESVYMLVDKKVELEPQSISELPEWSFLPENELQRLAILLFPNQRTAKRNCSRNQRVIKIPNTSVFKISKTYLLAKGITRLILEDSLISLEKELN